jgi:hypothetical protein
VQVQKEVSVDKNVWGQLRNAVRSAERIVKRCGKSRRPRFSDRQIVLMYFVSVIFDRPRCFACRRESLPRWFKPRRLPSYSQFCRRLHAPRLIAMIDHVARHLGRSDQPLRIGYIDGKELPISRQSTDPDATVGRGSRGFGKGYRLHAFGGEDRKIKAFSVRPLNEGEARIARELITHAEPNTIVLADANYDSRFLYDAARERNAWFLAPVKRNAAITRSRTTEARLIGVDFWRHEPKLAKKLYARRTDIERIFSQCVTTGGGLNPLPAWVRRLDRVSLWVTAKVAIHNARINVIAQRSGAG